MPRGSLLVQCRERKRHFDATDQPRPFCRGERLVACRGVRQASTVDTLGLATVVARDGGSPSREHANPRQQDDSSSDEYTSSGRTASLCHDMLRSEREDREVKQWQERGDGTDDLFAPRGPFTAASVPAATPATQNRLPSAKPCNASSMWMAVANRPLHAAKPASGATTAIKAEGTPTAEVLDTR